MVKKRFAIASVGLLAVLVTANVASAEELDPTFADRGVARVEVANSPGVFDVIAAPDHSIFGIGYTYFKLGADGTEVPFGESDSNDVDFKAAAAERQDDGKFVLAGTKEIDPLTRMVVSRLNADGSRDRGFGRDSRVTLPSDGKSQRLFDVDSTTTAKRIVVAGSVERRAGRSEAVLAALREDGSLDRNFGTNGFVRWMPKKAGYTSFSAVHALPSGKVLAGGVLNGKFVVSRFTRNGAPDRSFGSGGRTVLAVKGNKYGQFAAMAVSGSRIVLAGSMSSGKAVRITAFTTNGRVERRFGDNGTRLLRGPKGSHIRSSLLRGIALTSSGAIFVATRALPARYGFTIWKYTRSGGRDTSFFRDGIGSWTFGGEAQIESIASTRDGELIAGGALFTAENSYNVVVKFR